MPLTLTLTEGVIPQGAEAEAVGRITDAFLDRHGLGENAKMRENVTAHVVTIPRAASFRGGEEFAGAWIEWKVPSFALADPSVQKAFFEDATTIIHDLSGGMLPRDRIYANALHTVEGTWNMDGVAMSNDELMRTITA